MTKKFWLAVAGTGVALVSGVSAFAFAIGDDGFPGQARQAADERIVAQPLTAREKGSVLSKGAGGPTIATYFAQQATIVPADDYVLQEIRCPRRAGEAIDGGARTSEGIVISYLSKGSPDGDVNDRSYYVGLDDNSATNPGDAGGFVEVVCAKGIAVR
jgi:hypothetical protein